MFVRQTEQKPKELYYADSLLTQPTSTQSAFDNLAGGFASSMAVVGDVTNLLSDKPEGNTFRDLAESVQIMNQTPGIGWKQDLGNSLSNMLGYGLNPIVWGFGRLGGMAAEATVGAASKAVPEAANVFMRRPLAEVLGEPLGKYIPGVGEAGKYVAAGEGAPLTSAMLGEKYATAFGTFAGAGAPAAWYENYNADTKHIDWGGGASDMAKMGAFGLAIESIPFAWGVLRSKVARATDKSVAELTMSDYDKALADGLITSDEHSWMKDYIQNPLEAENLKQRASKILADNDVNVNTASHNVPVDIVKSEDMQNLNGALLDQSLADLPPEMRTSLSDYIIHNGVDDMRGNAKTLDGLRGFRDFIDQKLSFKDEKLQQADEMLDTHMLKSMTDNMPLSQQELFKTLTKYGAESDHVKKMPISIPDNVRDNIKKLSDLRSLEYKSKQLFKDYESTGNQDAYANMKEIHKKMEDVKQSIPDLMTPKQEIEYLRKKLLPDRKLAEGETEYYRGYRDNAEHGIMPDPYFGKGYWMTETKDYAKGYGDKIETIRGKFNLYDTKNGTDSKLNKAFEKVKKLKDARKNEKDSAKGIKLKKQHDQAIKDFRDLAIKKGYDGLSRPRALSGEVMLFKKPKLTSTKGLSKNWERSASYHRLVDLAHVWDNAKTLLDRVHLEAAYERQAAYRNLADHVLNMTDSNVGRFANRGNVVNYMRERIKAKASKLEPDTGIKIKVAEQGEVPENAKELLELNEAEISKIGSAELAKEFQQTAAKFKEFKNNEGVFKSLIQCVLGGLNG